MSEFHQQKSDYPLVISKLWSSALDLRFLGLCPQLSNVTLRDCPIADLFDYRNVVQRRLPEGCLLDDGEDSRFSDSDSKLMNLEDANFIKELVADGLLVCGFCFRDICVTFSSSGRRRIVGARAAFSAFYGDWHQAKVCACDTEIARHLASAYRTESVQKAESE